MGIKEKILTEKDKISAMNKEQKFEYFKAYYLAKLICAFVGIILLVWFVNDTFLQKKVAYMRPWASYLRTGCLKK